ncbi:protein kinase domain-containing protein [Laceyella putida]|uniref:Protein kinase n=1 Tax=Laceyella putida TaxID=110101 RepID=A0ABW2RI58_9BACL
MEGKQLGGRYEILHPLGEGGMAVVYKAKDHLLNRHVAIKVMNQKLHEGEPAIQRFIREAQTAGKFSHPNIVNVFDIGNENDLYYMVMELIEGPTLGKLIEERGPLPAKEAISIMMQICDGLAHAHKHEIIHRDIKPHNIMCTANGTYKITDFGISRLLSAATQYTKTGTVMGSVHYFSPEQACGQELNYSSDLYSLGIVLYELVTGDVPFDADQSVAIALKHLQEPVPDPRDKNQALPAALCDIIYKALEKKPEDRYQSAEELKQALQKALFAPAHALETPEENQCPTQTETAVTVETARSKPRKFFRFALLGTIPLVLILGFVFFNVSGEKAPKKQQTAQTDLPADTQPGDKQLQSTKPMTPSTEQAHHEDKNADKQEKDDNQLVPEPEREKTPSEEPSKEEPGSEEPDNGNPPPAQEPSPVTYIVIVDQFSDQANADNCVQSLKSKGIEASYYETSGDAGTVYVVSAGEFNDEQAANARAEDVRNAGYPNAKVSKKE